MNQLQNNKLILLTVPHDEIYLKLCSILQVNNYRVVRATTIQSAIQKVIEFSPDLIIYSHDLVEYDAFQAYNILRRSTLNCVIPYIVLVDKYDSDEIIMGLDLGIDNFIFTPLNEKSIITKLKLLFEKVETRKAFDRTSFEKLFVTSPMGMLICEVDEVVRANPAFYKLMGLSRKESLPALDDIFDFNNAPDQEKQFCRCLKGLTNDCSVSDVHLMGKEEYVVKLYISNISNFTITKMLVQIEIQFDISDHLPKSKRLIDAKRKQLEQVNNYVLTSREYDILKISGKGTPVKLIAEKLGISERTVEKHRSNIMRKTDSFNIIEAIDKVYGIHQKSFSR